MDWKRVIQLVKQTGERCVVFDADSDEPLVVMPLSDFEALTEAWDEDEHECDDDMFAYDPQSGALPADIPFEPEQAQWFPGADESIAWNEINEQDETIEEEPWYIEPITDGE